MIDKALLLLRLALIGVVRIYQKCLSPLTKGACRYYPTCSEYALWLLAFDNPIFATFKSFARIAKCNQLFAGGIAYPQARLDVSISAYKPKNVKYWLIPLTNPGFLDIISVSKKTYKLRVYIIKSLF